MSNNPQITDKELRRVFYDLRKDARKKLMDYHKQALPGYEADASNRVQGEWGLHTGAQFMDDFFFANMDAIDQTRDAWDTAWENAAQDPLNTSEYVRIAREEAKGIWDKQVQKEDAILKGIADGLGNHPTVMRWVDLRRQQRAGWQAFFDTKERLWTDHYKQKLKTEESKAQSAREIRYS